MKNTDRRFLRTHAVIRKSFEDLILKKEFNEITISELAKQADINRKTFYLHYRSLNDVLEELQQDIMDELAALLKQTGHSTELYDSAAFMEGFSKILARNMPLHRRIFCSGGYQFVFESIRTSMMKRYKEVMLEQLPLSRAEVEIFTNFISYGTLFIFRDWLSTENPLKTGNPAHFTSRLIRYTIEGLLSDYSGKVIDPTTPS